MHWTEKWPVSQICKISKIYLWLNSLLPSIEIWHGDTTQLLTRLMSHSGPVLGISFILKQNANTIVSISQDRTAKVWECEENGFNMCQTIEFPSVILCIAISHSEEMIALG